MNDTMMYKTMYYESTRKISNQEKNIEDLKETIEHLTIEMDLYKTQMRKELLRLQIKLGQKNDKKQVDS